MTQEAARAFAHDTAYLQVVSETGGLAAALWAPGYFWASCGEAAHPFFTDPALRARLESGCPPGRPGLFFEDETVFWGFLRIGSYYLSLGPAQYGTAQPDGAQQYAQAHGLSEACPLPRITLKQMRNCLSLLSCHFFGVVVPPEEFVILGRGAEHVAWESAGTLEEYQIDQSDYERSHKAGADFEDQMMQAVREGNVDTVKALLGGETPDISEAGQVAPEARKQMEYMVVSMLTLLTRAAIEGGLRPEEARELGDVYLNRLAATVSHGGGFTTLGLRAMVEFAQRVHDAREARSRASYVEACKAYVEANLRRDITVGQIAPALGVSRTYLSHLFKKAEGISLQQYIQREKCRHAERLLKFSDHPISLIAAYFGFSSASYFGVCFRQWYGVTPSEYRRAHARK